MAFTTPAGTSITKIGSVASGATGAAGTSTAASAGFGGKVLGALGLTNPWTLAIYAGLTITQVLFKKLFAPEIEPLPIRTHTLTGGREEARWVFGRRRIPLEWTDGTVLPNEPHYRDNHIRLIACVSEGACESVEGIWINQDRFDYDLRTGDSNLYIPQGGNVRRTAHDANESRWLLPVRDISQYRFPMNWAFQLRTNFKADGTEGGQSHTPARDAIPAGREYNGQSDPSMWGSNWTSGTTRYRDTVFTCQPNEEEGADGLCYPINRPGGAPQDASDPDWMTGTQPSIAQYRFGEFALEVKPIDASYKLNGISWIPVDLFQPFFQQAGQEGVSEESKERLYNGIPDVDVLMRGMKITWPGQSTPTWTANPVALLYWLDTVYRGIDASRIDTDSFTAAFDHCEETITYRYGAGVPAASLGSNDEWYVRSNGALYQKVSGAWQSRGTTAGDYAWFSERGANGVVEVKRYECGLELESGSTVEDFYEQVLFPCFGARYQIEGKIHYRVGVERTPAMTINEEDIIEVSDVQPWLPLEQRLNKVTLRLKQSLQNDWQPDTVAFADAAMRERDGELRTTEISMETVSDPIQAYNAASVILKKLRNSKTFAIRIAPQGSMEQADLHPMDVILINHGEFGWDDFRAEVQMPIVHLADRSIVAVCQELPVGTYDHVLALPDLPERRIQFSSAFDPAPPASLMTAVYAETQVDGTVLNFLSATWDAGPSPHAEAEYRRRQSIWTAPVSIASGVYYRATNMLPFTVGAVGSGSDVETASTQRYGVWLNYRGGEVNAQLIEARWDQMAGGGSGGAENPILNSAPSGDTRNLKFRRYGVLAANSRAPDQNKTVMQFSYAGGNTFATGQMFTALQEQNWRIILRDSAGTVFTMMLPTNAEDPDNPYTWDDGLGLRTFLQGAIDNSRTVDAVVVNSRATGFDLENRATLLAGTPWRPMAVAENTALASAVVEGDAYGVRVRNESSTGLKSGWVSRVQSVTGDLQPPSAPTGLIATSIPLGFILTFRASPEADVAFYEILLSDTETGGYEVTGTVPSSPYESGPTLAANVLKYVRVRAVDRRGNRSALSDYARPRAGSLGIGVGAAILSGQGVPAPQLGKDGDAYVDTDTGNIYLKAGGVWTLRVDITPTTGAAVYVIDIAGDATPMAGTTALVRGGTIPAAADIPAGSVAIDASDGRLWDWDGSDFVLRGRLKGTDYTFSDTPRSMCVPGSIRQDGRGFLWKCNDAGNGEILTGAQEIRTGPVVAVDNQGRQIWEVLDWPPSANIGKTGDGAWTPDGDFGTRGSQGWISPATGDFGGPTNTIYLVDYIDTIADLPGLPAQTVGFEVNTTFIRIVVSTGRIYRFVPLSGNWLEVGSIYGEAAVTSALAAPTNCRWENVAVQSDGTYAGDLVCDAAAGAVAYNFRVTGDVRATYTQRITSGTRTRVTNISAGITVWGSVTAEDANGDDSARSNSARLDTALPTGAPSAPRSFTHTVRADDGTVTFNWLLPSMHGGRVTGYILEMRHADGSLYRMEGNNLLTSAFTTWAFARVPSGTYSASIVATSGQGNSAAATIATITVPDRASRGQFPPPRNPEVETFSVGSLTGDWDPPDLTGAVAALDATSPYAFWIANNPPTTVQGPAVGATRRSITETGRVFNVASMIVRGRGTAVMRVIARYGGTNSTYVTATREYAPISSAPASPATPALTRVDATFSQTVAGQMDVSVTVPAGFAHPLTVEIIVMVLTARHVTHVAVLRATQLANRGGRLVRRFIDLIPGAQHTIEARLGGPGGMGSVHTQRVTPPRITGAPTVSPPTGLGVSNITATGGRVTGPSSLPAGVDDISYFVALVNTPNTRLQLPGSIQGLFTATAFPLVITGLTRATRYVVQVRYRDGNAFSDYTAVNLNTTGVVIGNRPAPTGTLTIRVSGTVQGRVNMSIPASAGAQRYTWSFRLSDGTGAFRQSETTVPNVQFDNVPLGSYNAGVSAHNSNGSAPNPSRGSFTVTQLAPVPSPPMTLDSPTMLVLTSSLTGTLYGITGVWHTVRGATSYEFQWYRKRSGTTTFRRLIGTDFQGTTTGNIAQIFSSELSMRDGDEMRLEVKAKAGAASVGPARTAEITVKIPTIALGTGQQIVRINSITLMHTSVRFRLSRPATTLTRFPYRTRTLLGTSDIATLSGTHVAALTTLTRRGFSLTLTGMTGQTDYRFWVRAQSGTSGSGTLYPETMASFRTTPPASGELGTRLGGQSGPGGQSEPLERLEIWIGEPDAELKPGDDIGVEGQEALVLNDQSLWIKRGGKWVKQPPPDPPPVQGGGNA